MQVQRRYKTCDADARCEEPMRCMCELLQQLNECKLQGASASCCEEGNNTPLEARAHSARDPPLSEYCTPSLVTVLLFFFYFYLPYFGGGQRYPSSAALECYNNEDEQILHPRQLLIKARSSSSSFDSEGLQLLCQVQGLSLLP
jgi:hypothetical protein